VNPWRITGRRGDIGMDENCLPGDLDPAMRQQFFKLLDGMFGNAIGQVAEPGKRIDTDQFTRSDEAAENSRSPAAVVAPQEGPVVPFMYTCT
jgi:hypothetical protein